VKLRVNGSRLESNKIVALTQNYLINATAKLQTIIVAAYIYYKLQQQKDR
jgi:hypothetical protein